MQGNQGRPKCVSEATMQCGIKGNSDLKNKRESTGDGPGSSVYLKYLAKSDLSERAKAYYKQYYISHFYGDNPQDLVDEIEENVKINLEAV
jgi:hypothetical protein